MKYFFILLAFTITSAFADADKSQVEATLDQMVREKVISAAEAEKAKLKMKSMDQQQWSSMNTKAATAASRMPASVRPGDDLDGAQLMQIKNDMERMIPATGR